MSTPNFRFVRPQVEEPECEICQKRNDLFRCKGCRVVSYCGRSHQNEHKRRHKHACKTTQRAHKNFVNDGLSRLRNCPDILVRPEDVFDYYAGHFWDTAGTRDYLRARLKFVDVVLTSFPQHRMAAQIVLDDLMAMLRLDRRDNLGLRNTVPSLMLRLGRDRYAYGFAKWWAGPKPDDEYEWSEMTQYIFEVTQDADLLEEPEWWTGESFILAHATAVMLIKLRILSKLRDLQNALRALGASCLPLEVVNQVRGFFLLDNSPMSRIARHSNLANADTETLAAMIKEVKDQIWTLYLAVEKTNMHVWSLFISMHEGIGEEQKAKSLNGDPSLEQAQLMLSSIFPAWEETPGAFDQLVCVWRLRTDRKKAMDEDVSSNEEKKIFDDREKNSV